MGLGSSPLHKMQNWQLSLSNKYSRHYRLWFSYKFPGNCRIQLGDMLEIHCYNRPSTTSQLLRDPSATSAVRIVIFSFNHSNVTFNLFSCSNTQFLALTEDVFVHLYHVRNFFELVDSLTGFRNPMQQFLTSTRSVSEETVSTVSKSFDNFMYLECALDMSVITIWQWRSDCFNSILG